MYSRIVTRPATAGTTLLLLLALVPPTECDGVWCYECGTGVAGEPDCLAFHTASSWTHFWRKCNVGSVCVKIRPAWNDPDLELKTVRGCSPVSSLQGSVHREGCWTHPTISSSITCYCHATLCNSASVPVPAHVASLVCLAMALVLSFL